MKRFGIFLLLLAFASSSVFSQELLPILPGEQIKTIVNELRRENKAQKEYIESLETNREEALNSIERQESLLNNYDLLWDDREIYYQRQMTGLKIWRATAVVSVGISVGLAIALLVR